jgi:hypothetical protein
MELRKAERKQAKIKLAIQGPSGSGKTMSALLIASGLTDSWEKIAVIDTEHSSADLYAHLGNFNVLSLNKPYSPERYINAIETCEKAGVDVIVIDSVSHEWEGQGGILETHGGMAGNSFTNWNKVTPRHNAFVQKILQSTCHIVATIRSKQDYVLTEKNGKYVPEKVGLKGVQREGMDYEYTIVFDLDIKHHAVASKDRTGLFMDKAIGVITRETGLTIKNWCNQGTSFDDIRNAILETNDLENLKAIYQKYPSHRDDMKPLIMSRKAEIEKINASDVNPKTESHGTSQSE